MESSQVGEGFPETTRHKNRSWILEEACGVMRKYTFHTSINQSVGFNDSTGFLQTGSVKILQLFYRHNGRASSKPLNNFKDRGCRPNRIFPNPRPSHDTVTKHFSNCFHLVTVSFAHGLRTSSTILHSTACRIRLTFDDGDILESPKINRTLYNLDDWCLYASSSSLSFASSALYR